MTDAATAAGGHSGIEQAAILLLSLGEKEAADVLKHLSARDVQRVGAAMAQVANVSRLEVMNVIGEFTTAVEMQSSLGIGSEGFIRKTLVNALGEDKAAGLIDRILLGHSSKGLEQLKWMDSRAIAEMVRFEHPQIVAIILAYLEADQSAEVIAQLPENVGAEVLLRIDSTVMQEIGTVDEVLGSKNSNRLWVFDSRVGVNDRETPVLLRQAPSDTLLLALQAADGRLAERTFVNISQRAAEVLEDDLATLGPVKLSEVEAAQKQILGVVRKLSEEGTINIGGDGGEPYV